MSADSSSVLKVRFDTSTMAHGKVKMKTYFALASDLRGNGKALAAFAAVTVISAVAFAFLPKILGEIIDVYISGIIETVFSGEKLRVIGDIMPLIGPAAALLAANVAASLIQGVVISSVTSGYAHRLRCRMFKKFNRLPASYADNRSHADIITAMTENVDALNQSLGLFLANVVNSAVVIIAVTAMMMTVDVTLSLVAAAFLAVSLIASWLAGKKEKEYAAGQQFSGANVNSRLGEFYGGLRTVQESGEIKTNLIMLENLNDYHGGKVKKARVLTAISSCIGDLTLGLCITAVTVAGAFMIKEDALTVGTLMTAVLYVRRLHQPVSQISAYANVVRTMGEAAQTVFAFLDEKEEKRSGAADAVAGDIEFENVTFAYPGTNEAVLHNVSLKVPCKGITSVSGDTGAGKSTLIKLMLRFYTPDEGSVLCGGRNVEDFDLEHYRKKFTVINQEATLFETTLAENIAYGKENADMQSIMAAAKLSGADEFISRLPDGYSTVFSTSPQNISNGEVQLVLLARAFLNKTPYVVFDEATAYVDTKTEIRVKETLSALAEDSAVIIIAHRRSTVENAERIIRIENGKVE